MAAGQGFKDFTTGEVLTAADVDGYLMQGIWVFASAAARDAAVTSPQEGNFAFLKDTNTTTYYTGSAWTNLDTTGMVNPMTTTGDMVYSSSGSTPARLGIGTAGQVLTVNSGATAPEWAAASGGGGMTLLATLALTSGSSVASGTISSAYKQFVIYIEQMKIVSGLEFVTMRLNGDTGSNYSWTVWDQPNAANTINAATNDAQTSWRIGRQGDTNVGTRNFSAIITIMNPSNTDGVFFESKATGFDGGNYYPHNCWGLYGASAAITSVTILTGGTFSAGNAYIYGVN